MNKRLYCIFLLTLLFSCRTKDHSTPVPDYFIFEKQGYMKGTISSYTVDQTPVNASFTYEGALAKATMSNTRGIYTIQITRYQEQPTLSYFSEEYMTLNFTLNTNKTTTLQTLTAASVNKNVQINGDTIVKFSATYVNGSATNLSLSNIVFDEVTGNISADYVLVFDPADNKAAQAATVTGSFNAKLYAIEY